MKKRILVFASGSPTGGGSGFQELVEQSRLREPILDADIVGVVSNYASGGVQKRAGGLKVDFKHWDGPFDGREYRDLVHLFRADFVMLSGWLKKVSGLDPRKTVNIHPGPLSSDGRTNHFGGPGLYGHCVHEAVLRAYHQGQVKQSAVSMHFVTEEYDRGPIFFQLPVAIRPDDTPETLGERVNEKERAWQSFALNQVVHGRVKLIKDEGLWRLEYSGDMRLPNISQ